MFFGLLLQQKLVQTRIIARGTSQLHMPVSQGEIGNPGLPVIGAQETTTNSQPGSLSPRKFLA